MGEIFHVVAGYHTRRNVLANNFRFPPTIVLVAEDGEDVAFGKREFFGDGGLVVKHSASWEMGYQSCPDMN